MGLKDELIKRAAGGSSFVGKQEEQPVEEETPSVLEDNLSSLNVDLSDVLDSNPLEQVISEAVVEEQQEFDLSSSLQPDIYQVPQTQVDNQGLFDNYQEQQFMQQPLPQTQPYAQPQQQYQPTPQFEAQNPYEMQNQYNPVQEQSFYQPQQQQTPAQDFSMYEEPSTDSFSCDNNSLGEQLLLLAKRVILEDVTKTFTSELLHQNALEKLVNSYLEHLDSPYTNSNAVLVSVIDEILASDYTHEHYGELVPLVLKSVKADLQ